MASDFHRPRARMAVSSTPETRRAVAPPERRLYATTRLGGMLVMCWTEAAACRRAVVMSRVVTSWGTPRVSK